MTTSWNGYGGNFGGLNLCCIGPKAQTCDMSHHNRFRVFESEDIDHASDDAHIDSTTKPGDNCDKGTLAGNVERKVMPRKYTIGDAIQIAKTRVANKQRSSRAEGQRILDELVADKTDDPLVVLACLLPQSTYTQADAGPSLCTNIHDEYEKIEMMVDSGASDTVASQEKFSSYPLVETTASGTTYSSAAEKDVEQIINVGQKYVQVVDSRGNESWAKFQMCKGLGQNRILGSVSRLVEAGHSVVFRSPELGSYIQNFKNGHRTYMRQHNGTYYLDLWVKKMPQPAAHSGESLTRPGQ